MHMRMIRNTNPRAMLMAAAAAGVLALAGAAQAQTAPADPAAQVTEVVVTATKTTRSSVAISGPEIQKLLPGISPLKAIETLPGVVFETADPWGNNEQNESLFVHGFSTQQLGYTMDGVPLGDQQYGNYNGLSPSRRPNQRERRSGGAVLRRRLAWASPRPATSAARSRPSRAIRRTAWRRRARDRAAATTPPAPSCGSTPARSAWRRRAMSPISTTTRAPGISTAISGTIRSTSSMCATTATAS